MKKYLAIALLLLAPLVHSAEETPAFLQPDVLKAAVAMNLTDEQKPQFQQSLTDFVNGRMAAFKKLMRGNNQTNMPRKMKSRTNKLLKQMDADVASFLTEEQMPAYELYRDTLKSYL